MSELEDAMRVQRSELEIELHLSHMPEPYKDCAECVESKAALARLERLVRLDERAKAPCEQYRGQGDDFMICDLGCDLGDDEADEHYAKRYRCPSCSAEAEIAEAVKEGVGAEGNTERT